jgi:O-antigen/teichoic acid export membrane protein
MCRIIFSVKSFLTKLFNRFFPKGGFNRKVTVLTIGTVIGQLVVVASAPLLTRLYTPSDFGVLAVFSSLLLILSIIAAFRYDLAIPIPKEVEEAKILLVLSCIVVTFFGFFILILISIIDNYSNIYVISNGFNGYLYILPLGVTLVGLYQILSYWTIRTERFYTLAKTKVFQGFGSVIIQLLYGLILFGPLGLILGNVVGRFFGITILIKGAKQDLSEIPVKTDYSNIKKIANKYKRFPLYVAPSGLINVAALQLMPIVLAVYYSPHIVGWYILGQKILSIPMRFVGESIGQVFLSEFSSTKHKDKDLLIKLYLQTAKKLLYIGITPVLILIISGKYLFSFIFGDEWTQAGVYVQILAFMYLSQFVVSPLSMSLIVLEKQSIQVFWDLFRLLSVCSLIIYSGIKGYSDIIVISLYGALMFFMYLSLMFITIKVIKRFSK